MPSADPAPAARSRRPATPATRVRRSPRRRRPRSAPPPDLAEARRLLVCLRPSVAEVVLQTPALAALRRAAPGAEITALGAQPALDLLAGDPRVDARAALQDFGVGGRFETADAAAGRALADWLDRRDFDLVLDAGRAPVAVARAIGARRLARLDADLAAEARVLAAGAGAAAALAAGAAAGWGLPEPPAAPPSLVLAAVERAAAAEVLAGLGLAGRPAPLAVCPLGTHPLERWPAERYAAVADAAAEEESRPVLLVAGDAPEAAHAVRRAMRHGERARLVPALPIKVEAAVLARAALLVASDLGRLHVAAALGLPTVAVFGPSHPNVFRPRHGDCRALGGLGLACPHRHPARLDAPDCHAAGRCLLGRGGCIERVSAAEVTRAVRERLAALPPAHAAGPALALLG